MPFLPHSNSSYVRSSLKGSECFSAADADITFQSSDGVLFSIHKTNLIVTTGGFPPPEFHSPEDGAIPLPEPSATLEILFQFLYPERHPKLAESMPFHLLDAVTEAAEKYQVFVAMDACEALMRKTLPWHADRIFLYAVKHGYNDLVDLAAIPLLDYPFEETLKGLPNNLICPWAIYYVKWSEVQRRACIWHSTEVKRWPEKDHETHSVIQEMGEVKSVITSPTFIARLKNTSWGYGWGNNIDSLLKEIPGFSTFIKP